MKITVGLGSEAEYERFVRAGADEFFCGYVPYSWSRKYGTVMPLNRREVLCYNVQIGAFSELEILAAMVKKYKKPVHLTFNSLYYIPEQYLEIAAIIRECMAIGFSSYIIADPALLVYLREQGVDCEVHLSGECGALNSEVVKALKELKLKRIIFPRKNTIREMESAIESCKMEKDPRMPEEFEAFALNELCQFSGAFCNSLHCDEMGYLCRVPYRLGKRSAGQGEEYSGKESGHGTGQDGCNGETCKDCANESEYNSEQSYCCDEDGYLCGQTGCGLCALHSLQKSGITNLKLVGRGNYIDHMEKDIRNLKKALEILEKTKTQEEYIHKMREALFPGGCSRVCYYL